MWLEIFMIAGGANFWFWTLMILEGGWLCGSTHYENGWSAGLSLFLVAGALTLFGDFNAFSWVFANPLLCLGFFGAYLAVGVVWSFIKWGIFCNDIKDGYCAVKREFFKKNNIAGPSRKEPIPDNFQDKWIDTIRDHSWHEEQHWTVNSIEDIIPAVSRYKATILFWMAYWPVSLLWSLLHDFIERLFNRIYLLLSGAFQSLANRTFAGIPDDISQAAKNKDQQPPTNRGGF